MARSDFIVEADTQRYIRKLQKATGPYLSYAIADTLTDVAKSVTDESKEIIEKEFVLRNEYTKRSMRFYKARPRRNINQIDSIAGTISSYLPEHEKGGAIKPRRSKIAVPMNAARRKKAYRGRISSRYKRSNLGTLSGPSRRQGKFFVLPAGNRLKKPAIFTRVGGKLRHLYYLTDEVKIDRTKFHSDAVKRRYSKRRVQEKFISEARRQMRRIKRK